MTLACNEVKFLILNVLVEEIMLQHNTSFYQKEIVIALISINPFELAIVWWNFNDAAQKVISIVVTKYCD